jgi:hypothetical protein
MAFPMASLLTADSPIAALLRRPLLLGGLGLTFGVWTLDQFVPIVPDTAGTVLWGAVALGSGLWWMNRQRQKQPLPLPVVKIDRARVESALAVVDARINYLASEMAPEALNTSDLLPRLRQELAQLRDEMNRQDIRLAVMGGKSVGKTSLSNLLQIHGLNLDATPAAVTAPSAPVSSDVSSDNVLSDDVSSQSSALESADVTTADLVMFLTAGDLTDSDYQTLETLTAQHHRLILVMNKQDQYLPGDRPVILQQLRERVQGMLEAEDVVAIATQPAAFKVRQYQPDGSVQERLEQPEADITALQERLSAVLTEQGQRLTWATTLRQAEALSAKVQAEIDAVRRDRALPIIEQYQWIAAATAFANPVPSLDLLATATINTQLVMDLSALYKQPFSLQQAKTVTATLASQMVKLGLVELSTQAIAPLLKSNLLTYVAGGTLQGLSAAHLTRLAGLSLVEYFQEQSQIPEVAFQRDRLIQKLKAVFQENQKTALLQAFVKQGIDRLLPNAEPVAQPQSL